MKNKTCGECQWYDDQHLLCVVGGDVVPTDCACDSFIPIKPTNGDVIRQGGNKRLITFSTEWSCFHCAYHNGIERKCERPEGKDCFDGIEAWLNAPADCVKQNGNHDTQADLCKADNTESEVGDE